MCRVSIYYCSACSRYYFVIAQRAHAITLLLLSVLTLLLYYCSACSRCYFIIAQRAHAVTLLLLSVLTLLLYYCSACSRYYFVIAQRAHCITLNLNSQSKLLLKLNIIIILDYYLIRILFCALETVHQMGSLKCTSRISKGNHWFLQDYIPAFYT